MAEITATLVKELREKTQAGMMDCKKALAETSGDFDAAVKFLREKGLASAAKRADRAASQGIVNAHVSDDNKTGVLFELNCETDFVARNENFQKLSDELVQHILKNNPKDVAEMLAQDMGGKTVEDYIKENVGTIGENIIANRLAKVDTEGIVVSYIHMGGGIGVLVELTGSDDKELAKDIAMHVAAANPLYLNAEDVPANVIDDEKAIMKEQMKNEGKPDNILDKIIEGKIGKYFQEVCLLEQAFVKDPDKKVKDLLPEGVTINSFHRFQVGA